jgi:branched-chain amino acid aminotransferase
MPNTWFNGKLIDGAIPLDPFDRGLTLGDGVFETIAVFNGKPAYLAAHLDRLVHGGRVLGINVPRTFIANGTGQLLAGHGRENGILRITITRGSGVRGLAGAGAAPTALITLTPWQKGTLNAPVRLATSSIRRNEHSPLSSLKTLSYAGNILAARDAAAVGADDALLLNTSGRIASSTISNLFAIWGSTLATPSSTEGVLPGIIRARILALAKIAGLAAEERPISPAELLSADAVFLTNSLRLIRPVTSLDGKPLSSSESERLRAVFDALCEDIARETGELELANL